MIFRSVLTKIFHGIEYNRIFLYFIKNYQCFTLLNMKTGKSWQWTDNTRSVVILLKDIVERFITVAIEICNIIITQTSKFLQDVCLSYLSRTVEYQRLAAIALFPFYKVCKDVSFHDLHFFARIVNAKLHFFARIIDTKIHFFVRINEK